MRLADTKLLGARVEFWLAMTREARDVMFQTTLPVRTVEGGDEL